MRNTLNSVLNGLLYSNIFIAIAAAAQVGLSYQLLGLQANILMMGLVFFATLALYNFSILLSKPYKPAHSPYQRTRWIYAHQRFIVTLSFTAISGTLLLGFLVSLKAQLLLSFLALIAAGYNLPFVPYQNQKLSLRNIPGIKLVLIAMVWSLSTVALPLLQLNEQELLLIKPGISALLILQRFIFIAAITIPFDIRDMYQDHIYGLKTLPLILGKKKAYQLCQILLAGHLVLAAWIFPLQSPAFVSLLISTLMGFWLIIKSNETKQEYFYFLFLDGVLILPYLIFLILAG